MNRVKSITILIITSFCFLFAYSALALGPNELSHKLAFLKNGEVWISDSLGGGMEQITNDSGKIDYFFFSPSLSYLAYAKIIGYQDEPVWDDTGKVPQRAVCSIVIQDPGTQKSSRR